MYFNVKKLFGKAIQAKEQKTEIFRSDAETIGSSIIGWTVCDTGEGF